MSKFLAFLFVILCLCPVASAQVAPEPKTLVPTQPVAREIAGGESHTYQITLQAGQFLRVVVAQRGIDIKLALSGPDGKPLVESDLTSIIGAREPLSYEATATGAYRLVIRAQGLATERGSICTSALLGALHSDRELEVSSGRCSACRSRSSQEKLARTITPSDSIAGSLSALLFGRDSRVP